MLCKCITACCFSLQNLRIERFWVEVNARVSYPIKTALVRMEENGDIDMDSLTTKFCVSAVSLQFANLEIKRLINAWNTHVIAGIMVHLT